MALQRTRVYEALQAKLFAATDWAKTYPAMPMDWNDVPERSIVVAPAGQSPDYEGGRRPIWNCTALVVICVQPGEGLDLVDLVESALERVEAEAQPFQQFGPGGPTTNLGGLCIDLRMGDVEVDFIRSGSDRSFDLISFDVTFKAR